jgi:hypothetical protein
MKRSTTVDISNPPDFDAIWASAVLPDTDREQWRRVMSYRTRLPEDAEILAAYGWTPADIVAARTESSLYWVDRHLSIREVLEYDRAAADRSRGDHVGPGTTPALMLLAEETARYHQSCANVARAVRTQYVLDLSDRRPKEERWSYEKIGELLGLSRQRVRQIVRGVGYASALTRRANRSSSAEGGDA